jgi:hypothetical protein
VKSSPFKRGSKYSRRDIGWIVLPETGRPKGGSWDTGYVRIEDKLIVFMNIGVPGRTDHDFDNQYNEDTNTITWYGKPNTHSEQPLFKQLLSGDLTPHYFARWNNKDPEFTYLGVGKVIKYKDGVTTQSGINTIQVELLMDDADLIILSEQTDTPKQISSFLLEKHLEDFLVKNWDQTPFAKQYKIYEEEGVQVGKQYRTETGPLDVLAISLDKSEFLVVELKRDRASDEVVGQISRYMGWVAKNLCNESQTVRGSIVALQGDRKLEDALYLHENITFLRYEIDFRLVEGF